MVASPELNAIVQRYQRATGRQTALAFLRDREAELRQLREAMRSACHPEAEGAAATERPEAQKAWPRLQERLLAPIR